MKSWHELPAAPTAGSPTSHLSPPTVINLFPYCLAPSSIARVARVINVRASLSLKPGNILSGCPVFMFTIWHKSSPIPVSNCILPFSPTLHNQKLVTLPEASNAPIPPPIGSCCRVAAYHPRL